MPNNDRIIDILRATGRPGMDAVIDHLEASGYFKVGAGGHHKGRGGLAQHCIEVYDFAMDQYGPILPAGSIAVAALFHDLGKVNGGRTNHWNRSVDLLDEWGFELTDDERYAIAHHHDKGLGSYLHSLRMAIGLGDYQSTAQWFKDHPRSRRKR